MRRGQKNSWVFSPIPNRGNWNSAVHGPTVADQSRFSHSGSAAVWCVWLYHTQSNIIWRNRSCSVSDYAYSYTFYLAWSVCLSLSSVCHIRAPCLNRLTDLDAIWQVHLWGPRHAVLDGGLRPAGEVEIGGSDPQPKSATLSPMLPPGEYKRGVGWTCDSDSALYQIAFVVVALRGYGVYADIL